MKAFTSIPILIGMLPWSNANANECGNLVANALGQSNTITASIVTMNRNDTASYSKIPMSRVLTDKQGVIYLRGESKQYFSDRKTISSQPFSASMTDNVVLELNLVNTSLNRVVFWLLNHSVAAQFSPVCHDGMLFGSADGVNYTVKFGIP